MDSITLQGEPVRAILFLHDDGATPSIFLRFGDGHSIWLNSFQYLWLEKWENLYKPIYEWRREVYNVD